MNLDVDCKCIIRIFFLPKYELLYRLELDGISARFCSSTLNQITNIEAQMGKYLKEKD